LLYVQALENNHRHQIETKDDSAPETLTSDRWDDAYTNVAQGLMQVVAVQKELDARKHFMMVGKKIREQKNDTLYKVKPVDCNPCGAPNDTRIHHSH
jgi:predicted Zn-ribbon and HTH transcriptional regulator